ncbi:MAG: magnesium transporter [Planctomycetota bacterium]
MSPATPAQPEPTTEPAPEPRVVERAPGAVVALLGPEVDELLDQKKFRELRDALETLPPPDIAEVLEALSIERAAVAFRMLPRAVASETFTCFEPDRRGELIEQLGDVKSRQALESLSADDRARVLDELPAEVSKPLIRLLDPHTRRETLAILNYPPDSVGRLMTPDYVRVRPEWSVQRSLEHIREWGDDAETVHYVYVVNTEYELVDDLHIRRLLLADPSKTIADVMDDQFVALTATDDREEAVRAMNRYDRSVLPVIDSQGILLGIVTHDDVADVAEEEATEDFQKQGGLEALGKPYMQVPVFEMVKKRGGWLCGLLVLQAVTIGVLDSFDEQLAKAAVLVVFIPLIISSGGNTGTQAASLLVRALAVGEVEFKDLRRIVGKELLTGLVLGLAMGTLAWGVVQGMHAVGMADTEYAPRVGVAVALSIVGIAVWAVLLGASFPLVLHRLKLDPASISSPLVATVMDVSGLVIYLVVATAVLGGVIL